ncbi:hypothetical protein GCM10023176_03740 [Micromonospora coerulea]|uniref:Uncharacterized protein n=1 Tax=Micromonospora coerulea TaxID=47856 RepID=A0ABP8S7I7_9ACTN
MYGDAAEVVRDVVVHDAAQQAPRRPRFGGDQASCPLGRADPVVGPEPGPAQAQRLGQARAQRVVQSLPGDLLDELAEHHEADDGVAEHGARQGALHQRGGQHGRPASRRGGTADHGGADRQAAGVGEQHGDGDP